MLAELGGLLLSLLLMRIRGAVDPSAIADRVARSAMALGGIWSLFSRELAIVRCGLPEPFCERLLETHDEASPVDTPGIRRFLATQLGREIEDVFETLEPQPIASSSLTQIHRGFLRKERVWVAVKVQRPSAAMDFRTDLRLLERLQGLLRRLTGLPGVTWEEIRWEVKRVGRERLDLRIEAGNMTRSRKKLRRHKVLVPRVFDEYSRRGLLVHEWVEGVSLHEYLAVRAARPEVARAWAQENGVEPERVARRLYLSMMRQVFEEELFHTAWHPENTLLLRDNWVSIVDFWAMSSVHAEFRTKHAMLHQAILNQEFRKSVDLLLLLGTPIPAALDRDLLRNEIMQALRVHDMRSRARSIPFHERSLCNALGDVERVLTRAGAPPSLDFMKIDVAFRILDRSLEQLAPNSSMYTLARRYWRDNRRRAIRSTLSRGAARRSLGHLLSLISSAPNVMSEMLFFVAERTRQQARSFQKTTSKVAQMLSVLFGMAWKAWAAVGVTFGLVVLERTSPETVALLGGPGRELLSVVPRLSPTAQWLAVLVCAYMAYLTAKLARRFAERDLSDPNLTRI